MVINQTPTTNSVEIRCHNIQWAVSKYGVFATGTNIIILKIFNAKRIANDETSALVLVSGFMSAVDITRSRSR